MTDVPDGPTPGGRHRPDGSTEESVREQAGLARRYGRGEGGSRSTCRRGICVCHPFCGLEGRRDAGGIGDVSCSGDARGSGATPGSGAARGSDDPDGFRGDERAIEGLPIRLVIALVVGVASLSVMMSMIGGIQGLAVTELDAQPEPEVTTPGEQEVEIAVVAPDGDRIAGATVIVRAGSAQLEGVATAETDEAGVATVPIDPSLGRNQPDGTLTIDIKPPAGSDYADERENTRILVVEEG